MTHFFGSFFFFFFKKKRINNLFSPIIFQFLKIIIGSMGFM
jgi:hypothetical protein